MKKYILILMLAMTNFNGVQAQRMLPKQKGLQLNVGMLSSKEATKNYLLGIHLAINSKHGNYWLCGAEYTHRLTTYRSMQLPLETYTAEAGHSLRLLSDRSRTVSLYIALTAVAGYETVNRGKDLLVDGAKLLDRNQFIYGASGRLSLETYLSDRFVFAMQGRTQGIWGTDLKQFRPSAGIGLRFNF